MATTSEAGSQAHGAPEIDGVNSPFAADRRVGWAALREVGLVVLMNGEMLPSLQQQGVAVIDAVASWTPVRAADGYAGRHRTPTPGLPVEASPPVNTGV